MNYYKFQPAIIISFLALLVVSGCKKPDTFDPPIPEPADPFTILHIAHTRSDVAGEIPSILIDIDYSKYDQLCHGGDVDINTSSEESTIAVWNDLFRFDLPTTHLSLGNHDTSNRLLVSEYTDRPSFYSYSSEGMTFLVLDTQLDSSRIKGEQLDLVTAVCDTISESGVLLVLTHKLLWMVGNDDLQPIINQTVNNVFGNCNSCTQPNNFYVDVYPQLVEVVNRGIPVICIAGDIGFNSKEFEYQTDEGVHLLASGIDARDSTDNKAIVLEYRPDTKLTEWRFEFLEDL